MELAIINCATSEPEIVRYNGRMLIASGIIAEKAAAFAFSSGVAITPRIHSPPRNRSDFPEEGSFDAVIVNGSKANIDEEGRKANPWMGDLLDFIRSTQRSSIPMLGICFGHQAMGVAFGSGLLHVPAPANAEIGYVPVKLTQEGKRDPLFKGIPEKFDALSFHFRCIDKPEGAAILAEGISPPIVQSFRLGKTWGVQFHPDYTQDNMKEIFARHGRALSSSVNLSGVRLETKKRYDEMVLENFLALAFA
ncbi:MAG: type 1 glutamine amidotransferase [Candidatus Micrarchaeota archaeon]